MNQLFCFRNFCVAIGVIIALTGLYLTIKKERKNISQGKDVRQKGTINPTRGEVTFDLGTPLFIMVFGFAAILLSYIYIPCTTNSDAVDEGNSIQNSITDSTSKKIDLNLNSDNIFLARIFEDKADFNGHIGVIIFGMALVNKSKDFTTIKDVLLDFDFDNKQQSEQSLNLETGISKNTTDHKEFPSLRFKVQKDTIYFLNWFNIKDKIDEGKLLHPGEILQGSAYYPLPITDINDFNRIKNLSISIIDYAGHKSNIPIQLSAPQPAKVCEFKNETFIHYSH